MAVLVLVLVLAWPVGLAIWANGQLTHVNALSGAANTPGVTYLIAGSDSRADGTVKDDGQGGRTDTIMVLQVPESGPDALISIPRDSYVEIPGHGKNKINAAYAWGGPPLLVQTVELLTGMTIDHYVEVGFGGVKDVVDAVGGVQLCMDANVNDPYSGLNWTAGCHEVDGMTALAFSRMRKEDPKGDIGRADRQRQVVSAVAKAAANPGTILNPSKLLKVVKAGVGSLTVDNDTNIIDLAKMALAFKRATGPGGVTGTPPIKDMGYNVKGVGSTVLLDPDATPGYFQSIMNGTTPPTQ